MEYLCRVKYQPLMKQTIITTLFALVALTGQAKTYKTIKAPKAMACVNVSQGEIRAREVIMRDTATTVHFTIEYPKGEIFRFDKGSYLMDEDGNRYALRACEGIPLNAWVTSPESGVTDFTMHFEPLPKTVQMFDFTEGDVRGAFMLLGIHDKKLKVTPPTFQQLSDTNPYTVPAVWRNVEHQRGIVFLKHVLVVALHRRKAELLGIVALEAASNGDGVGGEPVGRHRIGIGVRQLLERRGRYLVFLVMDA